MWTRDGKLMDRVQQWLARDMHESRLPALKKVICNLRQPLKLLSKNKCADIYTQQAGAREALSQIQAQLQQDPCNSDLLQREEASKKHYVEINNLLYHSLNNKARQTGLFMGMSVQEFSWPRSSKGRL